MKKKIFVKILLAVLLIFVIINILWFNLYNQYNSLVKNSDISIEPISTSNHNYYVYDPELFSCEDQTVASVWVPKYLNFSAFATIGNPMIISEEYKYTDDYTITIRAIKNIFFQKEYILEYINANNSQHIIKFKTNSDFDLINPENYSDNEIDIFQKHREEYIKYREYFYNYFGKNAKKII